MEESNVLFEQEAEEEKTIEETPENQESMEALLEEEGLGIEFPKVGETRTGTIASISDSELLVSVGAKSEGVIGGREFDQIDADVRTNFEVGKEIPVYILRLEDKNGNLVLSYNRAREEMDWDTAEQLQESDEVYEDKIIGYNKGGLLVALGRLRGFVPASQIGLSRRLTLTGDTPEKRYSELVNEPISVRVIEVDRSRRRLILSERMALKETRESLKEKLLENLQIGDVRTGRVTSLADFGAFVNIDGADGLVHLSEISWERIQNPKDVLKVGQEVKVEVISIDRDRKRIGLSIRRLQDNPWLKKVEEIREGQLVEGTITHLTKFGAFAKIGDGDLEGLIHVSELSTSRVEHPKEIVSEGDIVTLRVIKIDKERQRIGLSLRKVDSAAYADLDWKMLRDELDSALDEDETEEHAEIEEPEAASEDEQEEVEPEAALAEVDEAPEVEKDEVGPEAASEDEQEEVEPEAALTEVDEAPEVEKDEVGPEAGSEDEQEEVESEAALDVDEEKEAEEEEDEPENPSEEEEETISEEDPEPEEKDPEEG